MVLADNLGVVARIQLLRFLAGLDRLAIHNNGDFERCILQDFVNCNLEFDAVLRAGLIIALRQWKRTIGSFWISGSLNMPRAGAIGSVIVMRL